ncbi:MAG: hypothetical protein JST55_14335 [Bacteroidetes bacterium]|nr:hypothetical protein [Bacteroidota bacterium]
MKEKYLLPCLLTVAATALTILPGCGAIEGIFKAGLWVGIIGVVVVIGIITLLFKSFGGK